MNNTALYQNQAIRELESLAISEQICDEVALMERAGLAAFNALCRRWPELNKVIVLCGKGNNGGDALVVARHLHASGMEVDLYVIAPIIECSKVAQAMVEKCRRAGIGIREIAAAPVFNADLIVDGLLGSGLQGQVREPYVTIINAINEASCDVFALDVPSGLDVDRGEVLGTCVQAAMTMTFIGLKPGLFTNKGPTVCGQIQLDHLNLPDSLFAKVKPAAELIDWQRIKPCLPKRARDAHKGNFGHVLVVGGDYGMGGAVRMAAEAAMRVGAGLVTVATRPEHVSVVSGSRPEIMCHQVAKAKDLEPLLARATVLVVGPGLGKSEWAQELLNILITTDLPKVLDADALNLLAQNKLQCDDWILTPHPGEASRLLDVSCQQVQEDRFASAAAIQEQYGGVAVLKGAGTIVQAKDSIPQVCHAGNPGMATGGMGDILSGVMGGLCAQGLSLSLAATAGVLVHAKAADLAAVCGGERGLLATDLLSHLRELVNP